METQQKRQWGVTSAISEAHPTKADLELNDQLLDYLKKQNNFETPEGSERRFVCSSPRPTCPLTPYAGSRF